MYSKSIVSFLTIGLLTLAKINGNVVSNYTGNCNDIYVYMEKQGKKENIESCKMNNEGEVTELRIYSYCLENEHIDTILTYSTLESLEFLGISDWNGDLSTDEDDIEYKFDCSSQPTNYEKLSTLTHLKYLDLSGMKDMENLDLMANISRSVEILKIGRVKLTQEMVDQISQLTSLNSLIFFETEFSKELNFDKFKNLKNLTSLELFNENSGENANLHVQENVFENLVSLKKLVIRKCAFDTNSIESISNVSTLEELVIDIPYIVYNANTEALGNLKNLISLELYCVWFLDTFIDVSSFLFSLPHLKRFVIEDCANSIPTKSSWNWANLQNLEYLNLYKSRDIGDGQLFDINDLGKLPTSIKEFYLNQDEIIKEVSIPENIDNLKNLEVFSLKNDVVNSIPKSIGNLEKLRVLNLFANYLSSLPDEIGNLKNLEELSVDSNTITSIPESIGNLTNLKILNLALNEISNIPTSIGNLSSLKELLLSYNNIKEIPKSIGNLNLTDLGLTGNQIKRIPDEIGNIKDLVNLRFTYNEIINIPSSLGNLENLETLYLDHNLINDILPESFNQLQKLRHISVDNNINIKGKTLSSPNLKTCSYYPPRSRYIYSLCEDPDSTCKDSFESGPICDANNNGLLDIKEPTDYVEPSDVVEPTDYAEPTDYTEPTDVVEPTDAVEPSDVVEPTNVVEPTDYVEPTEVIDIPSKPTPSKELEYHHQCLKELEPYEVCEEYMIWISSKRKINKEADSICNAYEKANCREFFKSPFTYAPTCEKTVDTFKYDIISSDDSYISVDIHWNYSRSDLYCAKKSSGEYCNLFEDATNLYYDEDYDMDISAACGEDQCRESLINYFDALIEEDYYGIDKLDDYLNRIRYLQSEQCIVNQH